MKGKKQWLFLMILLIYIGFNNLGCIYLKSYQKLQSNVVDLSASLDTLRVGLEEVRANKKKEEGIIQPVKAEEFKMSYCLPNLVVFCHDTLKIAEDPYILERIEREFFLFLQDWGQVIIWLKRSGLYFPIIEEEISKRGLPIDLKYVPVVESSLLTKAKSSKEAWGLWQFIVPTGRRCQLTINKDLDERLDFRRATSSALQHLADLANEFKGDWYLALAAYNLGSGGLRHFISEQGTSNYFDLYLPEETARFVCRVIAIKIIFENYSDYGLGLWAKDLYSLEEITAVTISVNSNLSVKKIYQTLKFSPWLFHHLNPQILKDNLIVGKHCLYLPSDKYELFKNDLVKLKGIKVIE